MTPVRAAGVTHFCEVLVSLLSLLSLLTNALSDTTDALVAALVLSGLRGGGAAARRLLSRGQRATEGVVSPLPEGPPVLRCYTLLSTTDPDGRPAQRLSAHPSGHSVIFLVDGRPQRYLLTETPLHDGSFIAVRAR
ncbi:hypothetical protein AB0N81_02670 [Streptomyces sp. NPDC093510]|uniref:hypothetical protein n=1 Tax=Streptomyces sp. NPDC093510 TaxID=3155199 RepID=UPI00343F1AB1